MDHPKRWMTGLVILGLGLGLVGGGVSSTFTDGASSSAAVRVGTLTLTGDASGACSVTNMLPGTTPSACTFGVTYGGSVPVYLGLDILIETQAGNGGTALYTPADPSHSGLQVAVASAGPAVTYTVPAAPTACPTSGPHAAPAGSTCYEIDDELVSTAPFTGPSPTVTFHTAVNLPSNAATGYRGGSTQIILTAHAVQSAASNDLAGCTAGAACPSLHWS